MIRFLDFWLKKFPFLDFRALSRSLETYYSWNKISFSGFSNRGLVKRRYSLVFRRFSGDKFSLKFSIWFLSNSSSIFCLKLMLVSSIDWYLLDSVSKGNYLISNKISSFSSKKFLIWVSSKFIYFSQLIYCSSSS